LAPKKTFQGKQLDNYLPSGLKDTPIAHICYRRLYTNLGGQSSYKVHPLLERGLKDYLSQFTTDFGYDRMVTWKRLFINPISGPGGFYVPYKATLI